MMAGSTVMGDTVGKFPSNDVARTGHVAEPEADFKALATELAVVGEKFVERWAAFTDHVVKTMLPASRAIRGMTGVGVTPCVPSKPEMP